ncbi:unnamed protein product, partial [Prorocentrum cordatum]
AAVARGLRGPRVRPDGARGLAEERTRRGGECRTQCIWPVLASGCLLCGVASEDMNVRLLAGDHWVPAPLDRARLAIRLSFEPVSPRRFAEDAVPGCSKQLQRLAHTVAHGGGQGLDRWCRAAWGMID